MSPQHVAARHLDHTFEKLASAHLPLMAASPTEPLTLPCLAHRLPLRLHRRGALHFLRLFPRVFDLRARSRSPSRSPRPPPSSSLSPPSPPTLWQRRRRRPAPVSGGATTKERAAPRRFVSLEIYYVHGTRPVLLEQTWEDGSARAILLAEKSKH
uniref:PORR domain-containing protein n=1 Tax=Oryza barthii TaxID=65489 RepID=A0A0D3FD76_9ORYZ